MRRIALLTALLVLAPAGVAQAGGWATVELGGPPAGLSADTPWHVTLIVKQHGITPMTDVKPSVRITNQAGVEKTFPARYTGRPGHYAADVTFPSSGTWDAQLFDGFTDVVPHRLDGLSVGTGGTASSASTTPQAVMIGIVALLFLVGLIATVPRRGRRVARGRGRTTPRPVA